MSMQKLHMLQIDQLIAIAFHAHGIVTDDIEVETDKFVINKCTLGSTYVFAYKYITNNTFE